MKEIITFNTGKEPIRCALDATSEPAFMLTDVLKAFDLTTSNPRYIAKVKLKTAPGFKVVVPNRSTKKKISRKTQKVWAINSEGLITLAFKYDNAKTLALRGKFIERVKKVAENGKKILKNNNDPEWCENRKELFCYRSTFRHVLDQYDPTQGLKFVYTEAVNQAVFGMKSKQWKEENDEILKMKTYTTFPPCMRDFATEEEVLKVNSCEKFLVDQFQSNIKESEIRNNFVKFVKAGF